MRQRAAAYGRDMRWPAVARALRRELRARARRARRSAGARRSRRRRSRARPPSCPSSTSSTCALHDRRHRHPAARHLQRAALRRRLLPRRQRARAPADDAASRTRAPRTSRPSARSASRYLAFVQPRLRRASAAASATSCPTRDTGSRSAARRTATGARSGRSAPSSAAPRIPGRQSLGGQLFHAALPAVADVHEPARVGLHAARHRRVSARVPGRHASSQAARTDARRAAASIVYQRASAPDWPWFEDRADLLQRAPVAGAARVAARAWTTRR